jgi:hypothetical protein
MYLHFSLSYQYGEELNNSIALCVFALFYIYLPLLELEHGIRAGLRIFKYRRAICRLFQINLDLGQATTGRGAFKAALVRKSEEQV